MLRTMGYFVPSFIIGLCLIWNRQLITLETTSPQHSSTAVSWKQSPRWNCLIGFSVQLLNSVQIVLDATELWSWNDYKDIYTINWEVLTTGGINMMTMTMMTISIIMIMMTMLSCPSSLLLTFMYAFAGFFLSWQFFGRKISIMENMVQIQYCY